MQVAVAIAFGSASLSAAAQSGTSSITLYGRINTTVERSEVETQSGQSQSTTGLVNNASRWGLRGTEDLGGGLKALFQLESGFGSDTGQLTNNPSTSPTAGLFNREAFVGLSGGFGTIRFGRMTSALYFASADYISMHNHDTGTSSDTLFNFAATGVNNNNTVAYKTPDFFGGNVEVAYSFAMGFFPTNPAGFQELPGSSSNQTNLQVAINWGNGPLQLGGGYAKMEDKTGTPNTDTDMWVIRGLYEFGAFVFGAYYEYSNFTNIPYYTVPAAADSDRGNFRLSGMYTMGASEFHLNYGMADDFSNIDDSSANQWTIAYNYNLSKRTKVYAFYTQVDQDANVDYFGTGTGTKFSSVALGLRHNF
jgi:predicted porin